MISSRYTIFSNIVSALFIFLFTYTAISKLFKMEGFKTILAASPLIGHWAGFTAWSIVILEWVTVLLLIYPPLRFAGLFFSFSLMTVFTGYITIMLFSSSHLPCSCGGVLRELSWRQHLYLNIFLMLSTLAGLLMEWKRRKSLQPERLI